MIDIATSESTNDTYEMNAARQRVYQLLSSLFAKELDWPMVNELAGKPAQAFWQQLATQPEFQPHVTVIVDAIAGLKTEADLLELAADYCGLFLVGSQNSASPYASLYVGDTDTTLFGKQHHNIMDFLHQHKLQVQSDFSEPADHIAVMLAYAGHLSVNGSEKEQAEYLQAYIANWLSKFVAKIQACDHGTFYSELAQLTIAWIDSELDWLVQA